MNGAAGRDGAAICGATGNRTPDLCRAKTALYQLSYDPLVPHRHQSGMLRLAGQPQYEGDRAAGDVTPRVRRAVRSTWGPGE